MAQAQPDPAELEGLAVDLVRAARIGLVTRPTRLVEEEIRSKVFGAAMTVRVQRHRDVTAREGRVDEELAHQPRAVEPGGLVEVARDAPPSPRGAAR